MIRLANTGDMETLRGIWNACFVGEEGFGVFFFSELYKPEQTLVYEKPDGTVTSMLHMLPYTRGDGEPVTYVYGVGTLPEYRRRGHSAAVIREALRINGVCFLIPQEPWLFGFYEQFGFKTVFYKREFRVNGPENARRAVSDDIPRLNEYYSTAIDNSVKRTPTHWSHILQNKTLIWNGGYAIYDGESITEAFGVGTSSEMTNISFGMATEWTDEKAYLNLMYN